MVNKYISMEEISHGDLSGLESEAERDEALRRFARGTLNLTKPTAPVIPPTSKAGDKLLFDTAEAARYLSLAKSFIRKAYRSGKLPFVRKGARYIRFTREALDSFAMSGQTL
jgi:excisionase family DNA binding protein